jgi:hypothetical protein
VGEISSQIIDAKLDEAKRGIVSAGEGKGEYRPVQ